ncbi:MAG: FmdE family protein [Actinobacteria bacterium]|nr:FmdE family protein [Actinomycetota bacterium]
MDSKNWQKAVEFHGHVCPGLAVGFRSAELAMAKLEVSRSADEELVAIVENDACGTDALQVLTGCTFGKGNFFFLDHGKQVYTIASRAKQRAVRITVKHMAFHNPELSRLRGAVSSGNASETEKSEYEALQKRHIQNILESGEDCFNLAFVDMELPDRAVIRRSVTCDKCGEPAMETRTVKLAGKTLCLPCSKKEIG